MIDTLIHVAKQVALDALIIAVITAAILGGLVALLAWGFGKGGR